MITQCDLIKKLKLNDYKAWVANSFLGGNFSVVKANQRKDQNNNVKDVELVVIDNKSQKETSIFLTDFSCSDGLLDTDWAEFMQAKFGVKNWCHNFLAYHAEYNKPRAFEELYQDDDLNV